MFKSFINGNIYNFYKKIKSKINIVLFLILIAILIWIIISYLLGNMSKEENNEVNTMASSYTPNKTVINGEDVEEETYKIEEDLICKFVDYCNEGNVEEAYNMISSECKETLYPKQSDFEEQYYSIIFTEKRICNLQSWINNENYRTYRVRFISDIMSTGNYEESKKYQDYITVIEENGKKVLNINKYIYKENLETIEEDTLELNIKIQYVETYLEYEDYTFLIKNKTSKKILLNTLENISETMYIKTESDKIKTANARDLNKLELTIDSNNSEKIKIRYNRTSGVEDSVKEINFLKIVKDYDLYIRDIQNYNDFLNITIKL